MSRHSQRSGPPGATLSTLLGRADVLAHLAAHAARLNRLQQVFEMAVPSLASAARVANVREGKVVILAENGAVSLKLKQLTQTLLLKFCAASPELTEVEVRVQMGGGVAGGPRFRPAVRSSRTEQESSLSAPVAGTLQQLAGALPDQSPLKASLERLIERAKRRDD